MSDPVITLLEEINSKLDLHIRDSENANTKGKVTADFYKGEAVFSKFAESIKGATTSVRTTRFSASSAFKNQRGFLLTLTEVSEKLKHEEGVQRILAMNDPEKFLEVEFLVKNSIGQNMTIFLTESAYDLEIVAIDNREVFINFHEVEVDEKKDITDEIKDVKKKEKLLRSSLHIRNSRRVATEITSIFDELAKTKTRFRIDCKDETEDNLRKKLAAVKDFFDSKFPPGGDDEQQGSDTVSHPPTTGGAKQGAD